MQAIGRASHPRRSQALIPIMLASTLGAGVAEQYVQQPPAREVIAVQAGALSLRAEVWRPSGAGPFPAVLFNHGSYSTDDPLLPSDPHTLGRVFTQHGYVFLWLHRAGTGLSRDVGVSEGDKMARALRAEGVDGRNRVQLDLLEHDEMQAATAALGRLCARDDVDSARIAVVGHSFGGSLSLLMAARDPVLRSIVVFGAAAGSWNQSPALRQRLLSAVARISAPVFLAHTENDYSTAPGSALAAELQRLGKTHTLTVYPPFGTNSRVGHNMFFRSVKTWESDVFAFLGTHLR